MKCSPKLREFVRFPKRLSLADIVAKVENRTTPKISQMLIFSRLRHGSIPMAGFSLSAQSATAIATAQGVWDARPSSTHLNEHQAVRRDNKAAQNLFGIPHRYKAFLNLRFDTANRGVSQDSLERREFYLS